MSKKNLLKKVVLLGLVCGNILSCDQAWADAVNITIDSPTSVTPTDYGGGYNADDGIIWGISGSQTIGSNVINSVATVDGGVAATVYGITLDGGKTISVASLSGGIAVEANGDYMGAFGIGASVGEITIQELGNISATALGDNSSVVGIGNESYNNSGCSTANITFADGANITVSASSYAFGIYNSAEIGDGLFDTSYSKIGNINVSAGDYAFGYKYYSDNNSSSAEITFAEGKTVTVSSDGEAYGLYLEGLGTVDITKLGGITAETSSNNPAHGIYVVNKNEDSKKFVVEFATNDAKTIGGTISAYSASGENYGIKFGSDSIGTSEITGVKSITAGVKFGSPTTVTSGNSAGIYAYKGDNSVVFTGVNSSIEAKAAGNAAALGILYSGTGSTSITELGSITAETSDNLVYGIYVDNLNEDSKKFIVEFATNDAKTIGGTISAYSASGNNYGIMFTDSSAGTSEITGVKSITAGFKSDSPTTVTSGSSAGIFAAKGDNSVVFTGANSSIEAKAAEYGAAIGIMYNGTGSTLITGLGSITAEETSNSYVFGIYVGNHNTDSKKFVVKFATNDAKTVGGTISAYSASGENYGIMFANDSVGTSEITGVKSITAGVKPDSPTTVTSENSAGIYANNGNNSVEFVNNSGIDVKSQSSAYGICTVGGTLDVTGLGGITVAGTGNSAKLGFAGGTLNLINSTVAETEGVTTIGGYYGSPVLNLTNSKVSGPLIMSYGTLDVNITDANSKLSITEAHFGAGTGLNTDGSDKVSIDKLYIEGNGVTIDSVSSANGVKYYFDINGDVYTGSPMLNLTAGLDATKDKFTVGIDSTCALAADDSVVLLDYSSALSGLDVTNLCPKGTVSVNNDGDLVFTLGNEPLVIDVIPDDSASSNTVVVGDNTHANTAVVNGDEQTSDAVNWRDVYGGNAETGDANGNTVTVQGIADVKRNIYGGYSEDGSANNNKVEIKGGRFSDTIDIYGGRAVLGDANNNTVTIRDGRFDDVYGGYIYEGNGNAQNNTVKISGGEEFEKVCGGYIRNGTGNAQYNTVTITGGGTFEDSIWGGRASSGNAQHNTVTISGGNFTDEIYGGYVDVDSGNAQNNTVKISGGSFTDEIYGGYVDDGSGSVQNNIITISGGSFTDEIYGGYTDNDGGNVINNTVTINNGYFSDEIHGGKAEGEDGSALSNSVIIHGGAFNSDELYVYGGSGYTASNNSVIIDNGTFDGLTTVYGGSGYTASYNNSVVINDGTFNGKTTVYGGNGDEAFNNSVTINGGKFNDEINIYGGYCEGEDAEVTNNNVVINSGATIGGNVYGGYCEGKDAKATNNNVVINSGATISGNVYGGYSVNGDASGTIVIGNGTYNGDIYGGYAPGSYKNAGGNIDISGGTFSGNVYGGVCRLLC